MVVSLRKSTPSTGSLRGPSKSWQELLPRKTDHTLQRDGRVLARSPLICRLQAPTRVCWCASRTHRGDERVTLPTRSAERLLCPPKAAEAEVHSRRAGSDDGGFDPASISANAGVFTERNRADHRQDSQAPGASLLQVAGTSSLVHSPKQREAVRLNAPNSSSKRIKLPP